MGPGVVLRFSIVLGVLMCGAASAAGPFDFEGAPATQIVLSWDPEPPESVFESSMVNRVAGIAAALDPVDARNLATFSRRAERVGWPRETEVLGYAHVSRGGVTHTYRVGVTPDRLALFRAEAGSEEVFAIPADQCAAVTGPLLTYAGGLGAELDAAVGEVIPFPGEYRLSPVLLDETTIRERLSGGRQSGLPETERYLPDEQLFVRLPVGYTPRSPAGLLVWIPAGSGGEPPGVFTEAADAMNLIQIGAADSGNARVATDRYQLALDEVASATRRFHIDPARVYVTGISGGGRISSALAACFPDLFTGAVPIVGVNCYEHVPLGDGRFVPMGYSKPAGARWRLLRAHRIAVMSGPLDFNYREIVSAVRIFRRDRLDVRLFEYEDMAHTLPTAERFVEAIGWVDAPLAEAREKAWEDADDQLRAYLIRFDELPVASDVQRRLLERVAETAPWSPSAWKACELLGVAGGEGDQMVTPPSTTGTP